MLIGGLALLSGCSGKITDRDVTRIDVGDVARPVRSGEKPDKSGTLLMDVRRPDLFAAGHLPGAQNYQPQDIDDRETDPRLERYRTIIVYAQNRGDGRAIATAKRLIVAKYSDVKLFEEGFDAWVKAGLPVEKSPGAAPAPPAPAKPQGTSLTPKK